LPARLHFVSSGLAKFRLSVSAPSCLLYGLPLLLHVQKATQLLLVIAITNSTSHPSHAAYLIASPTIHNSIRSSAAMLLSGCGCVFFLVFASTHLQRLTKKSTYLLSFSHICPGVILAGLSLLFVIFPPKNPSGQSPQQVSNGERVVERREPRHRGGDRHPRRPRLGRRRHPGPRRSSAHPTSPRTPPTISQAP
jgi:hypothetical protein